MSRETPEELAERLVLFVDNDGDLYRQQTEPIRKNLVTKMARVIYDHASAVRAFMYLAESGAKKYVSAEHSRLPWHVMFPVPVRKLAAEHWATAFENEAKLGNYDYLLPMKYRKTSTSKPKRSKAARAGYSDGQAWANETNPSRSQVEDLLRQGHVPPDESLINALTSKQLASSLGLKLSDVTNHTEAFYDALKSYDQNFQAGATSVLDASEGN